MSGCLRGGSLEPCGDGLDVVASGRRAALRARVVAELVVPVRRAATSVLFLGAAAGLLFARVAARRSERR